MNKRVSIVILLMVAVVSVISFLYDAQIIRFISSLRTEYLDYIFLTFVFSSNVFLVFFFLTTLFLWKEHKRKWILPLILAFIFSLLISYFLKIGLARPRPFQEGLISVLQIAFHFMRNNFNTWNFSFPALNAVVVFAALPILNKEFKKFKYIWIIFACLASFSLVYFGMNYLSDVLGGAVIGYAIGMLMVAFEEKTNYGQILMRKLRIGN